ncbi:MAG: SUMF1/EgtB/PvdO family nonheme iron enzyme [Opitutales bacterium]|nr:SUMF1/EgtB/PvdO family nonheme iron enzyme [Opitutales bacterium]
MKNRTTLLICLHLLLAGALAPLPLCGQHTHTAESPAFWLDLEAGVQSIRIQPGPPTVFHAGQTYVFAGYARDAAGRERLIGATDAWSVTGPAALETHASGIARVTPDVVTSPATVAVRLDFAGLRRTFTMNVQPRLVAWLELDGPLELIAGTTEVYTLWAHYTNGDKEDVTMLADWLPHGELSMAAPGVVEAVASGAGRSHFLRFEYGGRASGQLIEVIDADGLPAPRIHNLSLNGRAVTDFTTILRRTSGGSALNFEVDFGNYGGSVEPYNGRVAIGVNGDLAGEGWAFGTGSFFDSGFDELGRSPPNAPREYLLWNTRAWQSPRFRLWGSAAFTAEWRVSPPENRSYMDILVAMELTNESGTVATPSRAGAVTGNFSGLYAGPAWRYRFIFAEDGDLTGTVRSTRTFDSRIDGDTLATLIIVEFLDGSQSLIAALYNPSKNIAMVSDWKDSTEWIFDTVSGHLRVTLDDNIEILLDNYDNLRAEGLSSGAPAARSLPALSAREGGGTVAPANDPQGYFDAPALFMQVRYGDGTTDGHELSAAAPDPAVEGLAGSHFLGAGSGETAEVFVAPNGTAFVIGATRSGTLRAVGTVDQEGQIVFNDDRGTVLWASLKEDADQSLGRMTFADGSESAYRAGMGARLSPEWRAAGASGQSYTINVLANGPWYFSSNESWISVEPEFGEGNAVVSVTLEENPFAGARQAMLDVGGRPHLVQQFGYARGFWADSFDLGNGWLHLEWWGAYADIGESWIYHEEFGWLYVASADANSLLLFDAAMEAWGWTGAGVYPWVYWFDPVAAWTLYDRGGRPGDRWFFHTGAQEWRHEGALGGGASDPNPTHDMVLVEGGTYARGDHKNESESWMARSRPVHNVPVSAFYMARTPVTYAEWKEVYDWAVANGYTFDNAGQRGSDSNGNGLSDTPENNQHPVTRVSWYDVVKWSNAKSEREGLTPVYHTNDARTAVYRQGRHDVTIAQVNWSATGYRLPTEAEWEKAARGGLVDKRWPWGDEAIDGTRANYWNSGGANGTTPVGSYPANGYGLYDMAGNVFEWNWDWFSETWYGQPGATEADTRGPVSGSYRVNRGGSWLGFPEYCRVASRIRYRPGIQWDDHGFRLARTQ